MTAPLLSAADWTTLPPPRASVDRYVATSTYSPLRQSESPNPNPSDGANGEEDGLSQDVSVYTDRVVSVYHQVLYCLIEDGGICHCHDLRKKQSTDDRVISVYHQYCTV